MSSRCWLSSFAIRSHIGCCTGHHFVSDWVLNHHRLLIVWSEQQRLAELEPALKVSLITFLLKAKVLSVLRSLHAVYGLFKGCITVLHRTKAHKRLMNVWWVELERVSVLTVGLTALKRFRQYMSAALRVKNMFVDPSCLTKSISSPPFCNRYARVQRSILPKNRFCRARTGEAEISSLIAPQFCQEGCCFLKRKRFPC